MAVGLWDSSFKNAFHTLSYRFAAVILVILYSRGKGKELKDAEQGCIADTLTFFDPAGAVSDPKKVRIWGNSTRFSLFFFDPADAVSDPKKVRILGNPTRFSLFFERKKGRRRAVTIQQ